MKNPGKPLQCRATEKAWPERGRLANPDMEGVVVRRHVEGRVSGPRNEVLGRAYDSPAVGGFSGVEIKAGGTHWESDRHNERPTCLVAYADGWIAWHEGGENPYRADDLAEAWERGFEEAEEAYEKTYGSGIDA